MPTSSRIIAAEALFGARRLLLDDLAAGSGGDAAPASASKTRDPSYEAGRQAGFRAGYEEGVKATRASAAREEAQREATAMQEFCDRASELAAAVAEQVAALEHSIADQIVDLAIELARQTARHSLETDRDAIVRVAQEAVAALLDEHAGFTLHLNPADIGAVRESLGAPFATRRGRIVADETIRSGGCRVVSSDAEVDATIETRWRRVLASIGRVPGPGGEVFDPVSPGEPDAGRPGA